MGRSWTLVLTLSSSTESLPKLPGLAIQKQVTVESPGEPEWKTKHLLSSILNTRGCPCVYCSVQCHLWPLNLVLYGEQQGWVSLYSSNFWIIGCIPSRASFCRWYCLLLGVSTPGLRSAFTGEACLTLPGLPAAHTMGFTWLSIYSGQDYLLPSSHGFIRNYQACSGGTCRCCSFRQKVLWVWRFNNKSLQKRKIISPTTHSNGLKKKNDLQVFQKFQLLFS